MSLTHPELWLELEGQKGREDGGHSLSAGSRPWPRKTLSPEQCGVGQGVGSWPRHRLEPSVDYLMGPQNSIVVKSTLVFERPGLESHLPPPSLAVGSWTNGLAFLILILLISKMGSTRPSLWVVVEIK